MTTEFKIKRKSETNEWVVVVYVNGKRDESKCYYTDDKQDAVDTMKHMVDHNSTDHVNISELANRVAKYEKFMTYVRAEVHDAILAESQGDLELRNSIAVQLFKNRNARKIVNYGSLHLTVETVWDGISWNYITVMKDSNGNEMPNACEYAGHKDDAAIAHLRMLNKMIKAG